MSALLSTNLQNFAIETVPTLSEALIALNAWKTISAARGKELWISFNCKNAKSTYGGDLFIDCVKELTLEDSVTAVGLNCTMPYHILPLISSAHPYANGKPFVTYPNHGETYNLSTQSFDHNGPDRFGEYIDAIPKLATLGVQVFGGCCRVNYSNIQQISNKIKYITAET
ncbi:hypothetical protein L596_004046 [Steinernema carpocapsae]|uniref:Hcy-binding domain-containing protein n=1 Tax=Steinernema carpocapsae TaxID=34508 RepID=A0A4U8UW33_STECR|nr:hypothetical protein L596_004046 [Steinernema carpocapsae]